MENTTPLIGILGELSPPSPNSAFQNFKRQGCVDTYVSIFEKLQTNAIIIPFFSNSSEKIVKKYISSIDGLLLLGGNDVTPSLYNETKKDECKKTNKQYDLFTINLINEAYKQKKPILGICRGAQMINITFNGTLYQDQKYDKRESKEQNHFDLNNIDTYSHKIIINKESLLYKIFQKQIIDVNSLHHQSINEVGNNLKLSALSLDGVVEAIEHIDEKRFIIGVQWHPETLFTKNNTMEPLFREFIKRSSIS